MKIGAPSGLPLWHAVHGAGQGFRRRRSRSRPVGERGQGRHRRRQGARQIGGRSEDDAETPIRFIKRSQQASMRSESVSGTGGGQGHHPAQGDTRPGIVPRRVLRSVIWILVPAPARSWWVRFSMPWSNGHDQQQCRHRHCLAFEGCGAGSGGDGASDAGAGGAAGPLRAAIRAAALEPASKASWRRSRKPGRKRGRGARRSRRGRDQQRDGDRDAACRPARPGGDLQRADRRGRGHGGDRVVGGSSLAAVCSTAEELYAGSIVP